VLARARPVTTGSTAQARRGAGGAGGLRYISHPPRLPPQSRIIQTLAHFACSRLPRAALVSLVALARCRLAPRSRPFA